MEGISLTLLALLVALLIIGYRRIKHWQTHWERMGLVTEKPNILFGNMTDTVLMRKAAADVYRDLYERYPDERFIGFYQIGRYDLIVKRPEDIKRVLITDFNHFKDRIDMKVDNAEPLMRNLFNLRANIWKPVRQTVSPAFTTSKLKAMIPLIVEVTDDFSKHLEGVCSAGDEVEFNDVMSKFTVDVIGSCAFGLKMNSMHGGMSDKLRQLSRELSNMDISKMIKMVVLTLSPKLYDALGIRVMSLEDEDFWKTGIIQTAAVERANGAHKRNDFIDLMLELKAKQEMDTASGERVTIDDNFILSQALLFFTAGFETSSTLMSFTLHELAFHPDVQDKVYEEICTVLDRYDGKMSYDIVSEMIYLDMVVSEAQRKYPALRFLFRTCTNTYTFPDSNITLEPGTIVTMPIWAIHFDPKYYPEPEKFIPERFSAEAKRDRDPMLYLPFGDGPRNCVGMRLGKMQSIIGLITVLKDYSVEPCSKTTQKIEFNRTSFVTVSKNGIWLKLKKRIKL